MSSIFSYNYSLFNKNQYAANSGLYPTQQNGFMSKFSAQEEDNPAKNKVRNEMRTLLQELKKNENKRAQNVFSAESADKVNGFLQTAGSPDAAEDDTENLGSSDYKYREISTKIQRAKNSVSAGQALISAKRTVMDIKRKLVNGKGDKEELVLALSHAKRMEMVARKKKHNLELEELVEKTSESDENREKYEDNSDDMRMLAIYQAEEEITEKEDEIFEEKSDMLEEAMDEMDDSIERMTEIADFGEEELKLLEEAMEMFESLEVVDPHMSEEDYKELVTKHRNSERKAIVKADMDYLKDMFKLYIERGSNLPILNGIGGTGSEPISIGVDVVV